jgi:glycosidase
VDHERAAEHPDWFTRDAQGHPMRRLSQWHDIMDFDLAQPEARRYLRESVLYWAREMGVDGFRFALPLLAPDDFWGELVQACHEQQPDLALIVESTDTRFLDLGFDATANPSLKAAMDFCRLDDLAQIGLVDDVWRSIWKPQEQDPTWGPPVVFLEDHAHHRSAPSYPPEFLPGYAAVVFTSPGVPQLLMGQEIGCRTNPDSRQAWQVDWERADARYLEIYRSLIALRASSPALRGGDFRREGLSDPELMTFSRTLGEEVVFCAANLSNGRPAFELPERLLAERWQEWDGRAFSGEARTLVGEQAVPPGGYRIWRRVSGNQGV